MKYDDILDSSEEQSLNLCEPVMATMVAQAPLMMSDTELRAYCQKHLDENTLRELEDSGYFSSTPIPFDTLPKTEEEWMQMAEEAEESGWVSKMDFLDHIAQWSHAI